MECAVADAGDRAGDGHGGQFAASCECPVADAGDRVGDGHGGQACHHECAVADAGHAGGDVDRSRDIRKFRRLEVHSVQRSDKI